MPQVHASHQFSAEQAGAMGRPGVVERTSAYPFLGLPVQEREAYNLRSTSNEVLCVYIFSCRHSFCWEPSSLVPRLIPPRSPDQASASITSTKRSIPASISINTPAATGSRPQKFHRTRAHG